MLIEHHEKCFLPSSTLHVWEAHMPCGGQMTAYANSFSLASLWALGMECRLLGLVTSTCAWTHRNKTEGSSGRTGVRDKEDRRSCISWWLTPRKLLSSTASCLCLSCGDRVSIVCTSCCPGTRYIDRDGQRVLALKAWATMSGLNYHIS